MTGTIADARVLVDVPLKASGGRRVVASTEDGALHVLKVTVGQPEAEQSFTPDGARQLAASVLAGDELAMTGRGTLRILAAALLTDRTLPDTNEARAFAGQCRMQARESLDPEYEAFMFRLANFLDGIASS